MPCWLISILLVFIPVLIAFAVADMGAFFFAMGFSFIVGTILVLFGVYPSEIFFRLPKHDLKPLDYFATIADVCGGIALIEGIIAAILGFVIRKAQGR